ncbi:hypothetical protein [Ralstonia solanacearum]|uniref:hypothetical protein n=1 Tax=Ralstonia solanacearum TaxID=305 RepID=UPI001E41A90C|nr:hypothetical protein [Ralstonia solanacearum]
MARPRAFSHLDERRIRRRDLAVDGVEAEGEARSSPLSGTMKNRPLRSIGKLTTEPIA